MNHNPHNLQVGDIVILDKGSRTQSKVKIFSFTTAHLLASIVSVEDTSDRKYMWEVMTSRLTPNPHFKETLTKREEDNG